MSVAVERCAPEDVPQVVDLYQVCFREHLDPATEADEIARLRRDLLEGGWVAREGERVLGFGVSLAPDGPYEIADATLPSMILLALDPDGFDDEADDRLDVRSPAGDWRRFVPGAWVATALGVDPTCRRSGVGRALTEARIEAARRHGARAYLVDCIDGSGSAELYGELGFEVLFVLREGYLGGEDRVVLGLRLGEPCDRECVLHYPPSRGMLQRWRRTTLGVLAVQVVFLLALAVAIPAAAYWLAFLSLVAFAYAWSAGAYQPPEHRVIVVPGPARSR